MTKRLESWDQIGVRTRLLFTVRTDTLAGKFDSYWDGFIVQWVNPNEMMAWISDPEGQSISGAPIGDAILAVNHATCPLFIVFGPPDRTAVKAQ